MASPHVPWLTKLRKMDAYPKTIEEFKVRTMQGGVCTSSRALQYAYDGVQNCFSDFLFVCVCGLSCTNDMTVSLLAFLFISLLLFSEVRYYFAVVSVHTCSIDNPCTADSHLCVIDCRTRWTR